MPLGEPVVAPLEIPSREREVSSKLTVPVVEIERGVMWVEFPKKLVFSMRMEDRVREMGDDVMAGMISIPDSEEEP